MDQIVVFGDVPHAQTLLKSIRGRSGEYFPWEGDDVSRSSIKKLVLVNLRFKAINETAVPFENLIVLNLSFNRIVELSGISHLTNLKLLDVSHNKIAELDPVKDMTNLEIIRFNDNLIEKLHPLWAMTSMKQIWASNNRLTWEELIFLGRMNTLEVLCVNQNPLEQKGKIFEFLCALKPCLKFINGMKTSDFLAAQLGVAPLNHTSTVANTSTKDALLSPGKGNKAATAALDTETNSTVDDDISASGASVSDSNSEKDSELDSTLVAHAGFFQTVDGRVMLHQARAHLKSTLSGVSKYIDSNGAITGDGAGSQSSSAKMRKMREKNRGNGPGQQLGVLYETNEMMDSGEGGDGNVYGSSYFADSRGLPPRHSMKGRGREKASSGNAGLRASRSLERLPDASALSALNEQLDNMRYSVHSLSVKRSNKGAAGSGDAMHGTDTDNDGGGSGYLAAFESQISSSGIAGGRGGTNNKRSKLSQAQNSSHSTASSSGAIGASSESVKRPKKTSLEVTEDESRVEDGSVRVRFGSNQDDRNAPIAFSMSKDKRSGYAKWAPAGPVACSLEHGKVLCLYRSGAIAVTLDAAGKGSIMDPKGKCVMVISDESSAVDRNKGLVAKVLDKRGNCVNSYDQFGSPSKKASTAAGALHLNDSDDASPSKRGNGNNSNSITVGKTNHVWRHEGLHIEFDPSTWDLKVLMNTDAFSCTFSSLFGIDLGPAGSGAVSGDGGASTSSARDRSAHNNNTNKAKSSSRSHGHPSAMTSVDRESNLEPSDTEESSGVAHNRTSGTGLNHASVRTGVQSVVSQLDDMLLGMKIRQKALN